MPANQVSTVLVARNRTHTAATFSVTRQFFIGAATVAPLLLWRTPEAALVGHILASILFGIEAVRLMIRSTPADSFQPSMAGIQELVTFSVPIGLTTIIGVLTIQLDKLIVSTVRSPEEFAVYAIGAIEIPFIAAVTGSLSTVILVDIRKMIAADDAKSAGRLFVRAAEQAGLILIPTMCLLFVVANDLITLLFSAGYLGAAPIFKAYLLRLPLRIMFTDPVLVCFKMHTFLLRKTVLSLFVNGIAMLTGLHFFGMTGGRDLLRRQQLTGIVTRESATFAWIRRVHRRNAAGKTRLDGGLLKRCHFGL